MENAIALVQRDLKCKVCGDVLSFIDAIKLGDASRPVCGSPDCQIVMSREATMPPEQFEPYLKFQKQLLKERKERQAEQEQNREQLRQREAQENANIAASLIASNPGLDKNSVEVVIIPMGASKVVELSQTRIEKYRQHLVEIIDTAFEKISTSLQDFGRDYDSHLDSIKVTQFLRKHPHLHETSKAVCAQCKGGCCSRGGEKAYLSPLTIRFYLDRHPQATRESILEDYLSRLEEKSLEGGCINQTDKGCVLPNEMRSDICNLFYCKSLKSFYKKYNDVQAPEKIVVIQRAANCFDPFFPSIAKEVVKATMIDA